MDCDVAIVGAGAAGISAARRLARSGRSVLLVEALPRLGGRAHTARVNGHPLDLGAGWLHSGDRHPLVPLAEAAGVPVDRREHAWFRQYRDLGFPPADREAADSAFEALGERLRHDPPRSDRIGDAIRPDEPWRAYIDGLFSFISGAEADAMSAADYVAYDDAATAKNYRVPSGLGALVAALGGGLPAALGTRVHAVRDGGVVTLDTDRGTISARAAIVAVSTAVLARGDIAFGPEADDHLHAARALPLGLADKVYLELARPELLPEEDHLLGDPHRSDTASHYIRPFGRPVIECYLGGSNARALERDGPAAAVDFVLGELRARLGADLVRTLSPLAVTRWGAEPTIGGSYSYAVPNGAPARMTLARPVSPRLAFAGEACSRANYSTVHGAWQSGVAAADHVEAGLTETV